MLNQAKTILKNVFGYDKFRSIQEKIIENVLSKKDTLVIMPTGGGKSLCYQIPALIFPGLTIVVSPLISLMKDQVEQLTESGVAAVFVNSSLPPAEYRRNVELVKQNRVKMLYLAPETLLKPNMLAMLSSIRVDCLAIDEAHCISAWGHDFRPEYRQLVDVRSRFHNAACIALTATATPRVREDIKNNLHFDASSEFIASFNRENLFIQIVPKNNPLDQAVKFIKKFPDQSGIIYCFSRKQVDDLSEVLKKDGFSVKPYHAGLSEKDRKENQELFIRDDVQIIVATIAFGMGINKLNIRFVVHFDLPKNIESYYQEIGRAGRDGLKSHCLLLFSYADIQKIKHFINQKNDHEKRVANIHLNALLRFAETDICRRIPLLNYFGEEYQTQCNMCDNCLSGEKERIDLTVCAQKFLSCIKRTGEVFGAVHIIDVLRGSKAQKVINFGHQHLSTYGIGQDYSKKEWMQLSRQFLHKELVIQDMEFGGLKLTEKAWDVLKGKEIFLGRLEKEKEDDADKEQGKEPGKQPGKQIDPEHDRDLFEILRKKRKELADQANIPPYVIFSDKTLIEMAAFFPQTSESLLNIHGIGEVKYKKYGQIFLGIIKEYCQSHEIADRARISLKKTTVSTRATDKPRHIIIGEAFNSGESIDHIMAAFNIKQVTVLDHLLKYCLKGHPIRPDGLLASSTLDSEQRDIVLEKFKKHGPEFLSPVFNALDGKVGYDELKILRLQYLSKNNLTMTPSPVDEPNDKPVDIFFKQIVCLANSRKFSGRCIAGKEIFKDRFDNPFGNPFGKWIRPVSNMGNGELTLKDITLQDGKTPELLDIITVPIIKSSPHTYQKENHIIHGSRNWVKNGVLPVSELEGLCDDVDTLWINGYHSYNGLNDRIPLELADERVSSSLVIIKPDNLCITVEEGSKSLKKVRAKFSFYGVKYWLTITDPVIEKRYLIENLGEYPVKENDLYLCVSIGEPWEGYCYKLMAGMIF